MFYLMNVLKEIEVKKRRRIGNECVLFDDNWYHHLLRNLFIYFFCGIASICNITNVKILVQLEIELVNFVP